MCIMKLEENLLRIKERIAAAAVAAGRDPAEITLCAATKVQTDDTIRAAIAAGLTVCGESSRKLRELLAHLMRELTKNSKFRGIGMFADTNPNE